MKIKTIASFLLLSSITLGQEQISNTAVVKFQSTGINDTENQAFFEYFLQELNNASQNNFINQKLVNQSTKSLELTTISCFTNECLKAAMDSTSSSELIAGTIQFSKNKFRVKIHKIESTKNKSKSYMLRQKTVHYFGNTLYYCCILVFFFSVKENKIVNNNNNNAYIHAVY